MNFLNTTTLYSKNTVNINDPTAVISFTNIFNYYLKTFCTNRHSDIILLCIGTDRSTGDSLGPLTGYKIKKIIKNFDNVHVFGTLDKPVHAKNLKDTIDLIYNSFPNPFIIAIDACLGKIDRVGYITVSEGPLKPGAGVKKTLPAIGDINITGTVNLGGFMEYIVLQNTRLSLVMNMAETIASSIYFGLLTFQREKEKWSKKSSLI
ncbi:spore protease YyaC [Caminicella sporogenes]|uniref:spore protease YyaC n=1 Tax=Caminicella sporogenes TaxID=166485 RepID=UPI003A7F480E